MIDPSRYNFKLIEEKWQSYWLNNKSFKAQINLHPEVQVQIKIDVVAEENIQ